MIGPDGLQMAQQDGGLPRTFAAGKPPGESGVAVFRVRCQRGLSFSAAPSRIGHDEQARPLVAIANARRSGAD